MALSKHESICPNFVNYFVTYYASRHEKWASCCRDFPHADTDSNMMLESFHNKLKTVCMDRRLNKRLDYLIMLLLKIEKDEYWRHKRDNIYLGTISVPKKFKKRNEKGMLISDDWVLKCSSSQYTIKSQSKDLTYKIDILQDTCKEVLCSHFYINPASVGLCARLYIVC